MKNSEGFASVVWKEIETRGAKAINKLSMIGKHQEKKADEVYKQETTLMRSDFEEWH